MSLAAFVVDIMGYRLLHWGPLLALSIIAIISWSAFMCLLAWWPVTSTGALLNVIVFFLWDILTLYNFFLAVFAGPGYVPLGWKPVSITLLSHVLFYTYDFGRELVDTPCCHWKC